MHPYADPAYAAQLTHLGTPVPLPRAGGCLLRRDDVPGGGWDATGPYPLLRCERWDRLADDLDELVGSDGATSVFAVADPLGGWREGDLRAAFCDLARPWKLHQVVDLTVPADRRTRSDHRRKARRAARSVDVAEEPARDVVGAWARLYAGLRERHGFAGSGADFPPERWTAHLAVPGVRAFVARPVGGGEPVGVLLFACGDGVAHYHLGASSPEGYAVGASFALFRAALDTLAAEGVEVADLGGGAGVADDPSDGLVRFKRGWATHELPAWLCGRVGDADRYRAACRAAGREPAASGFFPAYRG